MIFLIKEYKRNEFLSMIDLFKQENEISNFGMVEFQPDEKDGMTNAIIQDNFAAKLTVEQIDSLKNI